MSDSEIPVVDNEEEKTGEVKEPQQQWMQQEAQTLPPQQLYNPEQQQQQQHQQQEQEQQQQKQQQDPQREPLPKKEATLNQVEEVKGEEVEKAEADSTGGDKLEKTKRRARKAQPTTRMNLEPTRKPPPVTTLPSSNSVGGEPARQKVKEEEVEEEEVEEVEDEEVEEVEDDATRLIQWLGCRMENLLTVCVSCVRFLCRFLVLILRSAFTILPAVLGVLLFSGTVYLLRHYVIEDTDAADVRDYDERLKFLLRCEVWPVVPVFLAAVASSLRQSEIHSKFCRDSFEQALLFLFNLLLISTHIPVQGLVWVRAAAVTMTTFSMLSWLCLQRTKKRGNFFALPSMLVNFIAMATNFYVIFGQDLGYVAIEPSVTSVSTQTGYQGGSSYWDQVTVCHLVEKVFCMVE